MSSSHKFSREDGQLFLDRLANRIDLWYQQRVNGKYFAKKPDLYGYEPVSIELIERIFVGEVSCALPAIDQDGLCKWCAWDCDDDSPHLDDIEQALNALGLHPLREGRRSGRAGHCWLFFTERILASDLQIFDDWIREKLNIDQRHLEFFPKQRSASPIGNGLRMPFSINLKPEANRCRGWFDGVQQELQTQLSWFLDQPLTDAGQLQTIINEIKKRRPLQLQIKRTIQPERKRKNFDIWDYVSVEECSFVGTEHVTQCPVCANEGHDRSQDNLHITPDGSFICMYNQPGKTHTRSQIILALKSRE